MISPRALTKLVQPSRNPVLLHRPRLVSFLHQHIDRKLILVSASAGYGKTSLLIDFADDTPLPVCWYELDASDGDPLVFLDYLITTVRRRFPNIGEGALQILAHCRETDCDQRDNERMFDALVGSFVTELQENIAAPFVVVLDDYHNVADSGAIQHLMNMLLAHIPQKAHFIVSSRTQSSGLNLTRLAAYDEVAGLGVEDLQFTPEEIRSFMRQKYQIEITAQEANDLAARSEGWIAGILLTTPKLWQGLYQRLVRRGGTHEELFHYLATEAFERLDPDQQRFLLDCSILLRMDATICNELLGTQYSAATLQTLEGQNLFITRLDDESGTPFYRFHNLFHEFLRQRLVETDSSRWQDLNRLAAQVFEKRGNYMGQAIAHYFAAQMFQDAARVMEAIAQSTFDSGHWTTLAGWIDALPSEILESHPGLMVTRGMVYAETGKNVDSESIYARAIKIYEERNEPVPAVKVVLWRAVLWLHTGRYREALQACECILDALHESNARWEEARAYRTIGAACAHLGKYPHSVVQLEKALSLYQSLGDELRAAWLHHDVGMSLRFHDDPRADEHFGQALDYWRRTHNAVGLSTTLNSIGVRHYSDGDYGQAIHVLDEARDLAHQTGNQRNEAFALASLGDVYRDQWDRARALASYHQVLDLAESLNGFILTYALIALGETYLLSNDGKSAREYLVRAIHIAQSHHSNYEIGLAETSLGIWEFQNDQFAVAVDRLKRAVKLLRMMKRHRARSRLHLALAHLRLDDHDQAQRELAAIPRQKPIPEAITIPFLSADRHRLLPLIEYAVSKGIAPEYYVPVLEKLKDCQETSDSPAPQLPILSQHLVKVRALGAADVWMGDKPILGWETARIKELFFLLMANPEGLRKEQIIEALWPENETFDPSNAFHTTNTRLRHVIADSVVRENGHYRLAPHLEIRSDVAEFETSIQAARKAGTDDERSQAYDRAIAVYRGEYFEECYHDWAGSLRAKLRQSYLDALVALARIRERQDDLESTIALYQKFIEKDHDCEEIYRDLMRLQGKTGNRTGAMRTYHQCLQALDDLDVPGPSEETMELYKQIIQGENEPTHA